MPRERLAIAGRACSRAESPRHERRPRRPSGRCIDIGRTRKHRFRLIALLAALAALGAHASSPADDTYRVESAVIASGGATLDGGAYRLRGTLGQPATARLSAATFRLYDGFWSPRIVTSDSIFANGFDP
jgi:hypothetical protein